MIAEMINDDLAVTDSETSIELNFAALCQTHHKEENEMMDDTVTDLIDSEKNITMADMKDSLGVKVQGQELTPCP